MKDRTLILGDGTSLGTWLSQLRKSQRLTTQTLSSRIGVDDGNLSRVENDRIQPTIQTVVAICNGLGITWQQLYTALKQSDDGRVVRETRKQYGDGTTASPDPLVLHTADIQNWLTLWNYNADRAEQLLLMLYAEVQVSVAAHIGNTVSPIIVRHPLGEIFRLSPVHNFEINYPPIDMAQQLPHKLQIIYERHGLLMLDDVDFSIREQPLAMDSLAKDVALFVDTKRHTGISDKLKFADAINLDQALGRNGALIGMFWLAFQTRTTVEDLIEQAVSQNTSRRPPADHYQSPAQLAEQIRMQTLWLIRLCRWKQCLNEDDSIWLSELRQALTAEA